MSFRTSHAAVPRPSAFSPVTAPPRSIAEWLAASGSPSVRLAWNLLTTSSDPVLLTGPAGTGKSHLLSLYLAEHGERPVVLASTGVAALQIGGVTVHSFFRLPPRLIMPADISRTDRDSLYARADVIIVDEVSMLRADLVDAMDALLRRARGSSVAFGGARVLFVGDPCQLPPVIEENEAAALNRRGYLSAWFFHAKAFRHAALRVAELDVIYRQSDAQFARLLSRTRRGTLTESDRAILDNLVRPIGGRTTPAPLILTSMRRDAFRENQQRLEALPGISSFYSGTVHGDFPEHELPVPRLLELRNNARVMFVRNDADRRWANGTVGTIVHCGDGHVVVVTDADPETLHRVEPVTWEKVRYKKERGSKRLRPVVVGYFTQLPILLGWAATIHKAQGMTLRRVRVDLGKRAFAAGQTYVALSRARTASGIELARPIEPEDVWMDPRVAEFLRRTDQAHVEGTAA